MHIRNMSEIWKINGNPIPAPDRNVRRTRTSIATANSGRSDDGYNHIEYVRTGIRKVELKWSALSPDQWGYILGLLDESPENMTLTYPDSQGGITTMSCYAGDSTDDLYSYVLYGGLCRNCSVNLIEL